MVLLESHSLPDSFKDRVAHGFVEVFCTVWICITSRIIAMGTVVDISAV